MGKRLCNRHFSFLPMPLVSSIKDESKLPKNLLVGGQHLDRVMLCLKPFDFNDFKTQALHLQHQSAHLVCKVIE